jgi:hypothetical protein
MIVVVMGCEGLVCAACVRGLSRRGHAIGLGPGPLIAAQEGLARMRASLAGGRR